MSTLEGMARQAPDPETGDEKEVYAFYGLASYTAQVAERGLMQLALLLRLRRKQGVTKATFDRESDAISRRTFGQILKELSEDKVLEDDLRALLGRTLKVRNRLTHHFFWDHAEEFFSQKGRLQMIRELQDTTETFSAVETRVLLVVDSIGRELGVNRQVVDQMFEKLLAGTRQKYNSV